MEELVDEEVTIQDELNEMAELLRAADEAEKEAKKAKERVRTPFLSLISELIREEAELERQVIEVPNAELDLFGYDYDKWAARFWPVWDVVAVEGGGEDFTKVAIQENAAYKKYEFIFDGYKYGRTLRMKDGGFDVDGFLEEIKTLKPVALRKQLQALVTEETIVVKKFDEAKATKLMADNTETVTIFQKYTDPGRPEIALLPIKIVKETEE